MSVHKLATDVVKRIRKRYVKPWQSRLEKGRVIYVSEENNIDFGGEGTWLCMARSKYLLNRFKKIVSQQVYAYLYNGKSSLDSDETKAIVSWEKIRRDQPISMADAKNLINFFSFQSHSRVQLADQQVI